MALGEIVEAAGIFDAAEVSASGGSMAGVATDEGSYKAPDLRGRIALVAGATRGAGRGIAVALGEAGATVYCTGRSSRVLKGKKRPTPGRPETIEETAELVTAAGGRGIAARVDHTVPAEVKKLFALVKKKHQRLDILVNDVWGGDAWTQFGKGFWSANLENGLLMLKQAVHSHIITAHFGAPLMIGGKREKGNVPVIFEITDGEGFYYRGNIFYDLVKTSVIRLTFAMGMELRKKGVAAVAVTPGFLRSEAMLERYKVTEANWRDVGKRKSDPSDEEDFMNSESPRYTGRAIAALAADPNIRAKSGRVFSTWGLSEEYPFTDVDGSRPHWGRHAAKKYGETPKCDDGFYAYWESGLIEKMFPDWF